MKQRPQSLIEISHVYAGYDRNMVLKDVSLKIQERDFLGIIGPNGGGKTTLIKLILGLLHPVSGEITGLKNDLRIGYMPQTNSIDKKFPILVSEVVESGMDSKSKKSITRQEKQARTKEILIEMGIEEIASKPIGELSGGQLQRTLLARAVINQPELLILDEPNSYVDKRFETHFYKLLQTINEKTAIILVSHDIGTVISTVKNIACVNETLHYHSAPDVDSEWIEEHLGCPFEMIGHGNIPHRILKAHE